MAIKFFEFLNLTKMDSMTYSLCLLFFIFPPALQKLWKMLFISSKKLFSLLRYSNFCISSSLLFLPVSHCFRGSLKINLTAYDGISCLKKNFKSKWQISDFLVFNVSSVGTNEQNFRLLFLTETDLKSFFRYKLSFGH